MNSPRTVYLDHAATTPMLPAAVAAMTAHLLDVGNPSSLHASGRRARRLVEESRETIAQALNCRPGEIVFTSGGTEADNLAVKGIYWARRAADPGRTRSAGSRWISTSAPLICASIASCSSCAVRCASSSVVPRRNWTCRST